MSLTTSQKDELLKLIHAGQKIIAVKRYREITGVGLQEAMHAVTRMAEIQASGGGTRTEAAPSAVAAPLDPKKLKEAEAAVMAALRDNKEIEAIRRYRDITNLGLREAKDAVDAFKLAHMTKGRVNAKLAAAIIAKVSEGKKEEALTLAMSNAGLDDTEARDLIRYIKKTRVSAGSCLGSCLLRLFMMAALLALAWYAFKQNGFL